MVHLAEEVFIRKFQPNDIDSCRSLWRELVEWHRMLYEDSTIGREYPETYFDKHLSTVGENHLWVAVLASKVVGLIGLILREKEGEVEPLIVGQAHRHKGIGTKLINTVVIEAQKIGLNSLSIKPVLRNLEAMQFFNKQGFKSIGQIELYVNFSEKHKKKSLQLFGLPFDF